MSFRTNVFLDTHVYIKSTNWQGTGITITLWKYNIVISDILIGYVDVIFLLLAIILSALHENWEKTNDWIAEKSTQKNLCEGHHFFDCTSSFLCHFLSLFLSLLSLSSALNLLGKNIFAPKGRSLPP